MTQIVINNIAGVTYPVDVYVADVYGNNKVFLVNIPTGPVPPALSYTTLPSLFDNAPAVMMIVIDANGCESFQILPCTVSQTPTNTPTPTPTPTNNPTTTPTPTLTQTPSTTPTNTQTPSTTPTNTQTPSTTPTNTNTPTPTQTPTNTVTPGLTATATPSNTPTSSPTPSVTTTQTPTPSVTATQTSTPSVTPTNTPTVTQTPTTTVTPGLTPTQTPSTTPTKTPTPTASNTPTTTPTPSITQTQTVSPTPTKTPTQTPTATITPTVTQTPTNTSTPTPTQTPSETQPQFFAYVFPEPQDSNSAIDLGTYMFNSGASWFGYINEGVPGTIDYSTNLDIYAHFSGFTGSSGNFITPVSSLKGAIRQSAGSGTDSFGCTQSQYSFGTIQVTTSQVNPNVYYFYTVWIPLNGVGGVMNNMTLDIGLGSSCSTNIINDGIPDPVLSQTNVTVTAGAAVPAGTYRVLWMYPQMQIPTSSPLTQSIFIKGDTKT